MTQPPGLEILKNATGSDVVTETDRHFRIVNYYFKNSHLYGMFKMLFLERHHKWYFTISAIYGCRNKLRYFPLSSLRGVGIRSFRFYSADGALVTRVNFICVTLCALDNKKLPCKSGSPVKSRVSIERREAEIMSKLPAFGHWLSGIAVFPVRLLLGYKSWAIYYVWLVEFGKTWFA